MGGVVVGRLEAKIADTQPGRLGRTNFGQAFRFAERVPDQEMGRVRRVPISFSDEAVAQELDQPLVELALVPEASERINPDGYFWKQDATGAESLQEREHFRVKESEDALF